MPVVLTGRTFSGWGANLALIALAVMLILASPIGMFGVVLGWVLLVLMAFFGLWPTG